jgi:hypothetical protein
MTETKIADTTEFLFIVDWYVFVFIAALPHTSTDPAVHTATVTAMSEHDALTVS